ncbi:sensor histidine kinase [Ideonella dechloratans]|uniref:sensor histidine kinase n=1 Tax=Ideonella dechloratans TaxID=36863 RepID=UPI0035AE4C0B
MRAPSVTASDAPAESGSPWRSWRLVAALGLWAGGWCALMMGSGRLDLANQALILLACGALAAVWLPMGLSIALGVVGTLLFNWVFVPPQGTFRVDGVQNLGLLLGMLLIHSEVALLLGAQRREAARTRRHAREAEALRRWSERLREGGEPLSLLPELAEQLRLASGAAVALRAWPGAPRDRLAEVAEGGWISTGTPADDEARAALNHVLVAGQPMGPGTGYHEGLGFWVLPLRGTRQAWGAAALQGDAVQANAQALRLHLQALCDLWGAARQRAQAAADEQAARLREQAQGLRNALLAAVSHDHRTPLATILAAASSLEAQGERMAPAQRQRLARTIIEETEQLRRLTDNTLQLARLGVPGLQLKLDWESPEEVVGAALHRLRRRLPEARVSGRAEPDLPLLHCDALLLAQLLDNLLDNALRHSPPEAPIEVLARRQDGQIVLAVRDRGPGVPAAWRDKVFEAFQRGPAEGAPQGQRAGAGLGLAVCRAIARAHGGEMRVRPRAHGGSAFECWLPVQPQPAGPESMATNETGGPA